MKISIADAVFVDNDKVLLVQERKQSAYGLWNLPGGHVEPEETPEQAVYREVKEELGVTLVSAKPFKTYPLITATGEFAINTFTGNIEGSIVLKDDELIAYGWFSLDSLMSMPDKLRDPVVLEIAREVLGKADVR